MFVGQCILLAFQVQFFTCVTYIMYLTCVMTAFVTLATCVCVLLTFRTVFYLRSCVLEFYLSYPTCVGHLRTYLRSPTRVLAF